MKVDVIVAGGGVAGLLLAGELAEHWRVLVLEKNATLPTSKYWLTDSESLRRNPELRGCAAAHYETLDFIAYDGTMARVAGPYVLWQTDKLVALLEQRATTAGATIKLGVPVRSYWLENSRAVVLAGSERVSTRLLIDCMGFGSPIVSAKRTVRFLGFFTIIGQRLSMKTDTPPIGLHNPFLQVRPSFFELFPDGTGHAYGAMIAPTRSASASRHLARDFRSVLDIEPYRDCLSMDTDSSAKRLFGIIPVGVPKRTALNRVAFFGEAAQIHPPTSATGMTKILRSYGEVAQRLSGCLASDSLDRRSLERAAVAPMSSLNRRFQVALFRRLLSFTSDDFRQLVIELERHPDELVTELIFAEHSFHHGLATWLLELLRPTSLLRSCLLGGVLREPFSRYGSSPRR